MTEETNTTEACTNQTNGTDSGSVSVELAFVNDQFVLSPATQEQADALAQFAGQWVSITAAAETQPIAEAA